jgi:nitrous oxidase accessory protein NosD
MKRAYIFALTLVVFAYLPVSATIIDIPDDYPTIQEGIDASADGDTVLVQPGTYVENINFNGHNIVLGSLFLTTGDTTYISTTIIDGDSAGTVVTFESGENHTCSIIGFTIADGYTESGGGIYITASSPNILNNHIFDNSGIEEGGGIYCEFGNPTIYGNVIADNSSAYWGSGGGIYCFYSTAVIRENYIQNNFAYREGGGIHCQVSSPEITGNIINLNSAYYDGGGAIRCYLYSNPKIHNNVIFQNESYSGVGAISCVFSQPDIINNTIVDNTSVESIGGIATGDSRIINTICRGNSGAQLAGTPIVSYCNIEGGWSGEGNVDIDALFRDSENGDFHLMAMECGYPYDSPCIDVGHPEFVDSVLSCSWGLVSNMCDMGAFGGGQVNHAGRTISVPSDFVNIQDAIFASLSGDTILVYPGLYHENIDFTGKTIVVGSLYLTTRNQGYVDSTIIDGGFHDPVVTFVSGESNQAVLTGFTIRNGNSGYGGGIRCLASSPTIGMNKIIQNIAFQDEGNDSYGYGGGIYSVSGSPVIEYNVFSENHAQSNGSGIFLAYSPSLSLRNNLFAYNTGGRCLGIFYESFIDIENCVLSNNTTGIHCNSSDLKVNNCIIRNIQQPEIVDHSYSIEITYTNIRNGWPGEGNIDADPLFRDPENDDFHLMSTECGDPYDSPCIDAGHPDILDSLLDCSWGLGGLRSDMGAYGGGDSVTVSIDNEMPEIPNRFALAQNYPNPFNASTVIRYSLPEPSDVIIEIYDILGRKVETLVQGEQQAGYHQVIWNAGKRSSGMYFYRIEAGEYTETRKMVLLK